MKRIFLPLVILVLACAGSGCYYDKESVLYPVGVCDTAAVTFSGTVLPILLANCATAGCHANPSPQVGVLLSEYSGAQSAALNGTLMGTINHASGSNPMPQNADKLSDCQISRIRIWVAAGAPNN